MHHVQEALPLKAVVQGHYQVEAVLSRGEAGNTYLVRDKRLGQQRFILKEIVHLNGKVRYRFPIEPELLQQLEHPALPHVYHAFTDVRRARSYLLVEFITGSSVSHLLSQQPQERFGLSKTMELIAPIMDVAAYLHRQRPPIVHRDIKPSNIIVSASGRAFLVDFGLAKQYDVDATTSVLRFGSPGYCAPEQYGHQGTSSRVDIYALGATFYKCLTGTVPIESVERVMQLNELKKDPLVPLDERMPGLPSSVVTAVHRALSVDSDTRFATVEQFWEALEQGSSKWLQRREPIELVGWQEEEKPYAPISMELEEKEPDRALSDVSSTPVLVGRERGQSTEVGQQALPVLRSRRKLYLRSGALVALVAILFLSIGMSLSRLQLPSHSTSTSAMVHLQVPRSRPTAPASPLVVKSYQGTMYNIARNTRIAMSLIDVRRQQHTIRGTFYGPLWNGLFVGMIDVTNHIQFVAMSSHGQETFSFNGAVRGDGTLAGSYCEPTLNGKCRSYGLWSVVPET